MDNKQSFGAAKLEYIPISSLRVHPKVQREYDEKWAGLIGECWNPLECEPLAVIKGRANGGVAATGLFYVIDGQHRLGAAKIHYGAVDQMLPCMVYTDLPLEEQAKLYLGFNNKKAQSPISKWNVKRIAKDTTVLAVDSLLREYGLRVAQQGSDGCVRCVAALEKIYAKPGPDTLRQTLTVLKDAWGTKVEAYDQLMIKGLAGVLQKAGAAINHKELATRLARHGTPARFIGEARQYAKLSGIGATRACSEIIVNVWNKRKQEKAQITL